MEGITPSVHTANQTTSIARLSNCHILITHTTGHTQLQQALMQHDNHCHHLPLLGIIPKKISRMRYQVCSEADTWIFLSQHSCSHNRDVFKACLDNQQVIAIGPSTAQHLRDAGIRVDAIPTKNYSSQGILQLAELQQNAAQKILIFSESSAPQLLLKTLKQRGHDVAHIPTYQQQPVCGTRWSEQVQAAAPSYDYITVHSQNGLCHLLHCLNTQDCQHLKQATLVVPTTAMQQLARKNGFTQVLLSKDTSTEHMVKAMTNHHAGRLA